MATMKYLFPMQVHINGPGLEKFVNTMALSFRHNRHFEGLFIQWTLRLILNNIIYSNEPLVVEQQAAKGLHPLWIGLCPYSLANALSFTKCTNLNLTAWKFHLLWYNIIITARDHCARLIVLRRLHSCMSHCQCQIGCSRRCQIEWLRIKQLQFMQLKHQL
jgi:hypothetical protein